VAVAARPGGDGYWLATNGGAVYAYGAAPWKGSKAGRARNRIWSMAGTPSGNGYWLVALSGEVFAYGDAHDYGGTNQPWDQRITGIAATPSGKGYWLVSTTGRVFAYGDDAHDYGATNQPADRPIVDIAAKPAGNGYWLAAVDGQVFTYGDDTTPVGWEHPAVGRVMDLAPTPTGRGYLIVVDTGQVFAEGDSKWYGRPRLRGTTKFEYTAAHDFFSCMIFRSMSSAILSDPLGQGHAVVQAVENPGSDFEATVQHRDAHGKELQLYFWTDYIEVLDHRDILVEGKWEGFTCLTWGLASWPAADVLCAGPLVRASGYSMARVANSRATGNRP
jgi:hypothetical protein